MDTSLCPCCRQEGGTHRRNQMLKATRQLQSPTLATADSPAQDLHDSYGTRGSSILLEEEITKCWFTVTFQPPPPSLSLSSSAYKRRERAWGTHGGPSGSDLAISDSEAGIAGLIPKLSLCPLLPSGGLPDTWLWPATNHCSPPPCCPTPQNLIRMHLLQRVRLASASAGPKTALL